LSESRVSCLAEKETISSVKCHRRIACSMRDRPRLEAGKRNTSCILAGSKNWTAIRGSGDGNSSKLVCSSSFIGRTASSMKGANSSSAACSNACFACCQLLSALMGTASVYKPYSWLGFSLTRGCENSRLFREMVTRSV